MTRLLVRPTWAQDARFAFGRNSAAVATRTWWIALVAGLALMLSACATDPATRVHALAASGHAAPRVVRGTEFEHVVFTRNLDRDAERLHIYIPGDGQAFTRRGRISTDPTPRDPLTLQLMLRDPAPSAYVGRPCYLGKHSSDRCTSALWTTARYSESVVASMTEVVRRISEELPSAAITLVGYSGGGVLAVLVANRIRQVDVVVTIGANLDIDAWTGLHGYTPLSASLNPAGISAWRTDLRQVHLVGGRDRNVPVFITTDFAQSIAAAEVHTYDTFDHRCCWIDVWPRPLDIVGRVPRDGEIPLD